MDLLPVSAVARARHLPVSVRAGAVPRLAKISRAAWRGLSGPGRAAECEQARAVSQQRMRAFPWHLEFLPAALSVGVQRRRLVVLSAVLGQLGAGGDQRMLVGRTHRCQPGGKPFGEARLARRDSDAQDVGKAWHVLRGVPDVAYLFEFDEQRDSAARIPGTGPGHCSKYQERG